MNRCNQCNLTVADQTTICPLCNSVLEKTQEQGENMYPDIMFHKKGFRVAVRIYFFLMFFSAAILILINYFTRSEVWWSFICGAGMIYGYVTLKNAVSRNSGHIMKIWIQMISAAILALLIDYILGYQGWSVDYAIPVLIMVMDVTLVILMLIDLKHWQNYIVFQIFMGIWSVCMMVLYAFGIVKKPILTLIALLMSLVLIFGTIILGDRKAKNEIKRKFHL